MALILLFVAGRFGWDALRAEEKEDAPAVLLTVRDAAGVVVRRLQAPTTAGLHRVAWDLRGPAAAAVVGEVEEDERPAGVTPGLLVVHGISLPPGRFGGPEIEALFTNTLDWDAQCVSRVATQCGGADPNVFSGQLLLKGEMVDPFTRTSRLFERTTGQRPFMLPDTWQAAREELDPDTPFNFVATTDITGGNSGSPIVAADGSLVGLAFDGNIHSIAIDIVVLNHDIAEVNTNPILDSAFFSLPNLPS